MRVWKIERVLYAPSGEIIGRPGETKPDDDPKVVEAMKNPSNAQRARLIVLPDPPEKAPKIKKAEVLTDGPDDGSESQ